MRPVLYLKAERSLQENRTPMKYQFMVAEEFEREQKEVPLGMYMILFKKL
jgi:hypothetical protein